MTREELLQDVQIGNKVKLYTESGEVFEGEIIDIGPSGLKLNILGTGKSKRIIYERITEYDIEYASDADSEQLNNDQKHNIQVNSNNDIQNVNVHNVIEDNEEASLASDSEIDEQITKEIVRREELLQSSAVIPDTAELELFYKNKLTSEQKQQYSRVRNILDYAKKIKEYYSSNDRVKKAVSEYKILAKNSPIFNVFIGLIYHEFSEFDKAVDYYFKGGAFDSAFMISLIHDINIDFFKTGILAVRFNEENTAIVKWLCEYAVANNEPAIISFLVKSFNTLKKEILLYWFADKSEILSLPSDDGITADKNIEYLNNVLIDLAPNTQLIEDIIDSASTVDPSKTIAKQINITPVEKTYLGTISFYKKDGGYGYITDSKGEQVFFHIRQVKDYELQRILATDSNYKRRVTFLKGINFKDEIAADAIKIDYSVEGINDNSGTESKSEYDHIGFLDYYDMYEERGIIRSDNNTYNFFFSAIKDPLLLAKMKSLPYTQLNLEVEFNSSDYTSNSTGKNSKIATEVIGTNKYTEEEIEIFIKEKLVTRKEVNDWISEGDKDNKKTVFFKEVVYEPLRPITPDSISQIKSGTVSDGKQSTITIVGEDAVKKAISLVISPASDNPFLSLKKENVGRKYYREAYRWKVGQKNRRGEVKGVNLKKAEELFIKAIQSNDQMESSVANLVNIYIQNGGQDITKGLQLLKAYGYLFSAEKLTNMYIQLIDKNGNLDALVLILNYAIPRAIKKNTVWQYMAKLAGIYYKKQDWAHAIEWFNKSLDYLDNNKQEFVQYLNLRNGNLRSLIIAEYRGGNKEKAIQQAKAFLSENPDDLVVSTIANGIGGEIESISAIDELNEIELQYEDDLLNIDNNEISHILKRKLQEVDLSITFGKVSIIYEKLNNGVFKGTGDDAIRAVEYINDKLLKNKRGMSPEYRSAIYIGIARIISDSRNTSEASSSEKVSIDEVKKYVARYARYYADVLVEKYQTNDSIRFMYIQALKYLTPDDVGNITVATNMLIASFFIDTKKLPDELHSMYKPTYKDSYYGMDCVSIKDFLIATFMLQARQDYVTKILEKVFAAQKLHDLAVDRLCKMSKEKLKGNNYYDFDALWKSAQRKYYTNIESLGKEISESVTEYHMVGSINQHIQRIKEIMSYEMLWNQDERILGDFIRLIELIESTIQKYTVEEKIEGFRSVESEIIKLSGDIEKSPTEFSYDYVYSKLSDLRKSIREKFDELYCSSSPECEIFLSNNSVYVNENTAEIGITFKNADNKQDADAVEIELNGSSGATFIRCEKQFSNIRSGEEQGYIAIFQLDNNVITEGQFEIQVAIHYRYRDAVDSIKTDSIKKVLPVNITDKDNYVPVENKYDRIMRGSSVSIRTPELFKGRNDLINSICASMSISNKVMLKNRGIILWGQRRVGKNSVKDYLKEKIREEYSDAYLIIELGSIGKCRNLREVLITIINTTQSILEQDYEDLYIKLLDNGMKFDGQLLEETDHYMPEFSIFMQKFSKKLEKISGSERNIPLYFIDEFSYLYEWIEKGEINGKEFMRFWKSFIQDFGICAIIIAQDNIPVWKSRYENEFACMNHNEITYLDFEGAKELICEPCEVEGRTLFAPDAVKLIYDWTKGSAYLIVIFCKHVIDYLNYNFTEKATKTIVQLVFEKEFIDKKAMFESDDFEPQIQDVANVGDEGELINQMNEKLLKEIACATITSSQVRVDELKFFNDCDKKIGEKVFRRLKDRKIIEVERDTYCSISMPLLKLYLLRAQSLLDKETLNKIMR